MNELSSALKRRFNTVILPPPATAEEEVRIVRNPRRQPSAAASAIPGEPPGADQIRRVVAVFRELREGVTEDGKAKVKQSSGSDVHGGGDLGRRRKAWRSRRISGMGPVGRCGTWRPGLQGAVVKDPVQDAIVWREYLETVVKERPDWRDLYRAARETA